MEQVLKIFNIDEESFHEQNNCSNYNIKEKIKNKTFSYLDELDSTCFEYLEFGADKCEFNSFIDFCNEIDIYKMIKQESQYSKKYHYYTKDRKVTFTISRLGDYVHYFGMTGEKSEVLRIFEIFNKYSDYETICWGGRDFI